MYIYNFDSNRPVVTASISFEKTKETKALIDFLETIQNTQHVSFSSPVLYRKFIARIRETRFKTTISNISLCDKVLRSFRKTHGLPRKSFDQDVIIGNTNGFERSFSKELLMLSSSYFRTLFSSKNTQGSRIPKIQFHFSDKAIELLLNYFCSKKIPSNDVNVLQELFSSAFLVDEKSFTNTISEKIITILIDKKNRNQFSLEAICGLEDMFLKRYFLSRNIPVEFLNPPNKLSNLRFSINASDLSQLLCVDDSLSEFFLARLSTVRFDGTDYTDLGHLPEKCRRSIRSLQLKPNQNDLEELCLYIHSIFPNLERIRIEEESVVEEYLRANPNAALTKSFLGIHYLFEKLNEKHPKAMSTLRKAAKINANYTLTLAILSDNAQRKGNFDEAVAFSEKALEIDPYHVPSLFNLGNFFLKQDRFDEAIPYLENALTINPHHTASLATLGDCFRQINKIDEAVPLLEKAIKLEPKPYLALAVLGDCFRQMDRIDDAIPLLEKAIKFHPKPHFALSTLGDCLRQKGQVDKAIALLERSLRFNPRNSFTLGTLGECFRQNGQIDKAIGYLQYSCNINPGNSFASGALGDCLRQNGEIHKAIGYLKESLNINPRDSFALGALGDCLRQDGQINEAIGYLKESLNINPRDSFTLGTLGDCLRQDGQINEAMGYLEDSLDINSRDSFALGTLGDCLRQDGRINEAIGYLGDSLKIDPNYTFAFNSLKDCFEQEDLL